MHRCSLFMPSMHTDDDPAGVGVVFRKIEELSSIVDSIMIFAYDVSHKRMCTK